MTEPSQTGWLAVLGPLLMVFGCFGLGLIFLAVDSWIHRRRQRHRDR